MRTTTTALLFLLFFLLTSCGGGGSSAPDPDPDPVPPTVLNVFPKDLSARTGSTIRFIAELDKPASSYTWDFGGGALPTTATTATEFQPLVILGDPGTYTATLTVCAAECADPFQFTYTVTPNDVPIGGPRILSVTPTGTAGARGTEVTFSAQIEGEADVWEWDFASGTTVATSTEAEPRMSLLRTGVHQGAVTARLSGGTEDTFEFAYEVLPGVAEWPPIIEAINLPGPMVCDNKTLPLSADILSDFPMTFAWQFSNHVTPTISTNSIARITTRLPVGQLSGSLIASNQFGASDPVDFHFQVLSCPEVNLSRGAIDDEPRGILRMNVDNVGFFRLVKVTATAPDGFLLPPSVRDEFDESLGFRWAIPESGTVSATVQASLFKNWGGGDPGFVNITDSDLPAPRPQFQRVFTLEQTSKSQGASQLLLLQGKPVLIFIDVNANQLVYATAHSADPRNSNEWTQHPVMQLPAGKVGSFGCTAWLGRAAVMLEDDLNLWLFLPNTASPGSTDDWRKLLVPASGDKFEHIEGMSTNAGLLKFMAFQREIFLQQTIVVQALTTSPATGADLSVTQPFDPGSEGSFMLQRCVNWQDRMVALLHKEHAADSGYHLAVPLIDLPLTTSDWAVYSFPHLLSSGVAAADLVPTDSRLWVLSLVDFMEPATTTGMFTTVAQPVSAADWGPTSAFQDIIMAETAHPTLTAMDGRFIGACFAQDQWWFYRGMADQPARSRDWVRYLIEPRIAEGEFRGRIESVIAHDGRMWFAPSATGEDSFPIEVWSSTVAW